MQQVDYGQLPLKAKHYLIGVMEYQEMQAHYILLARERFPQGVPAVLGFKAMFARPEDKDKKVMFDSLTDLDAQYASASDVISNPLELLIGQLIQEMKEKETMEAATDKGVSTPKKDTRRHRRHDTEDRLRHDYDVELEAQKCWWLYDVSQNYDAKYERAVADYLRPKYAGKTVYDICGATTDEAKREVLCAFWRKPGRKLIDLGDESWIENNLYVKPDGTIELHFRDDLYQERNDRVVTGPLEHQTDVAMVDQAIKWITQEREAMEAVREKWQKNGLAESQLVECTLVKVMSRPLDSSAQEEIQGLPDWFLNALNEESRFYSRLPMQYMPERSLDDILFALPSLDGNDDRSRNLLKSYFIHAQNDLSRYQRLLTTPEELYEALGLEPSASLAEVKKAYRKIANETRDIHIKSADDFDQEEWEEMNLRFMVATRAYKALTKHGIGEIRITTLGRISSYFENN